MDSRTFVGRKEIFANLAELAEFGILNERMLNAIVTMDNSNELDDDSKLIVVDADNCIVSLEVDGLRITTF